MEKPEGLHDISLETVVDAPTPAFIARELARIDELEHRPAAQAQYCEERNGVFLVMQRIESEPDTDATWSLVPSDSVELERVRVHRYTKTKDKETSVFRLKTGHCAASAKVIASIIVANPATVRLLWNGTHVKYCRQIESFPEVNMQIVDLVVRPDWWSMVTPRRLLGLFWHRNDPAKRTNLFIWKSTGHRSITPPVGGRDGSPIPVTGWFGILIRAVADEMCDVTIYTCLDYRPTIGSTDALIMERLRSCISEWEAFAKFKNIDVDDEEDDVINDKYL